MSWSNAAFGRVRLGGFSISLLIVNKYTINSLSSICWICYFNFLNVE
jgi:hypothetical protein